MDTRLTDLPPPQTAESTTATKVANGIDWERFDRDGVLLIPKFFDSWESGEMENQWHNLARSAGQVGLKRADRFVMGGMIGGIHRHPAMLALALAHRYCGPDIALYMNRILLKDAGWSGAVSMHQDMPYFHGGHRKLSIFVPLKPVQANGGNGGVKFVLGSHKYGNLERGVIDRSQFDPLPDYAPSMDVGDIMLTSFFTWHWSEAATIAHERPLMQIVYQPADDGSFAGETFGVAQPTLASGKWKTTHFVGLHHGVIPDVPTGGAMK